MGESILKGISAALGVTAITLLAGLLWTAMGYGGLSTSTLVDIGLIASCIAAGYVTGRKSGQWIFGGVSSLGYVLLCVLLVALFLELRAWGVVQVLAEGGLIGILAGAFGAGGGGGGFRATGWRAPKVPLWSDTHTSRGAYSDGGSYSSSYYEFSRNAEDGDEDMEHWDDLLKEDRDMSYEEWGHQSNSKDAKSLKKAWWEEDVL